VAESLEVDSHSIIAQFHDPIPFEIRLYLFYIFFKKKYQIFVDQNTKNIGRCASTRNFISCCQLMNTFYPNGFFGKKDTS